MKNIYLIFILLSCYCTHAQVGIGTNLPDDSAALHVVSTNQGLLVPKLSLTDRATIALPANGLLIFNTTSNQFEVNIGTATIPVWEALVTPTAINQSVKYSNTDITTDINQNGTITLPVISTLAWNDNTALYVATPANNSIQVTQAGRFNVIVNVSVDGVAGGQRDAPEIRIAVNGTPRGSYSSTGYIRNGSNHTTSSLHLNETFNLAANDVITVQIGRSANGGVDVLRGTDSSNILVNKVR